MSEQEGIKTGGIKSVSSRQRHAETAQNHVCVEEFHFACLSI